MSGNGIKVLLYFNFIVVLSKRKKGLYTYFLNDILKSELFSNIFVLIYCRALLSPDSCLFDKYHGKRANNYDVPHRNKC